MSVRLTLVAKNHFSDDFIERISIIIGNNHFNKLTSRSGFFDLPDWCENSVITRLRKICDENQADFLIFERRLPKLLCMDLESTVIDNEMLEELGETLGLKDKIAAITNRAMNGEIDFDQSLRERAALLNGLPEQSMHDSLKTLRVNNGAAELIVKARKSNIKTVLITGGFTFYSTYIANKLGFDHHHGNVLEVKDSVLTGDLVGEILGPQSKLDIMRRYCTDMGIEDRDVIAFGDGANDLPMLTAAGFGVGYKPKEIVESQVKNIIRHTDFTTAITALF